MNLDAYEQRLDTALRGAHAAGDTASAQRIASALSSYQANKKQHSAVNDVGPVDSLMIGAGNTFNKIGAGVASLFGGDDTDARINAEQAESDRLMAPLRDERPVTSAIGGALPYVATAPLSGGLTTQAALGAGLGGLEHSQQGGSGQAQNAMIGGGLAALPFGVGRAMRNVTGRAPQNAGLNTTVDLVSPGAILRTGPADGAFEIPQDLVDRLNQSIGGAAGDAAPAFGADEAMALGMRLTPGERTGNVALQKLEASLSSNPITSGPFDAIKGQNQRVVNEIAGEAIGVKLPPGADELSEDLLDTARTTLSNQFELLTEGRQIPVTPEFTAQLDALVQGADKGLFGAGEVAGKALSRLQRMAFGSITDAQYQSFSSDIGKQLRSSALEWVDKEPLIAVKNLLDDAVESSLGPAELAAFREVRSRWRNMVALEAPGVWKGGNVSGRSLANYLKRTDKTGFMYGRNTSPLYQVGRAAQRFAPVVGDSGTATRSFMNQFLNNPVSTVALSPAYAAARAYTAIPQSAALSGVGGLMAAPAVGLGLAGLLSDNNLGVQ